MSSASQKPSWSDYFVGIAEAASRRSSCTRSKVGAVIVKDRRVVSVGYNDSPAGQPGCEACPRRLSEATPGASDYDSGDTRCLAIHAEANALIYANREDLIGATVYVTREPCYACDKLLQAAGVEAVVWPAPEWELPPEPDLSGWDDARFIFGYEGDE